MTAMPRPPVAVLASALAVAHAALFQANNFGLCRSPEQENLYHIAGLPKLGADSRMEQLGDRGADAQANQPFD